MPLTDRRRNLLTLQHCCSDRDGNIQSVYQCSVSGLKFNPYLTSVCHIPLNKCITPPAIFPDIHHIHKTRTTPHVPHASLLQFFDSTACAASHIILGFYSNLTLIRMTSSTSIPLSESSTTHTSTNHTHATPLTLLRLRLRNGCSSVWPTQFAQLNVSHTTHQSGVKIRQPILVADTQMPENHRNAMPCLQRQDSEQVLIRFVLCWKFYKTLFNNNTEIQYTLKTPIKHSHDAPSIAQGL